MRSHNCCFLYFLYNFSNIDYQRRCVVRTGSYGDEYKIENQLFFIDEIRPPIPKYRVYFIQAAVSNNNFFTRIIFSASPSVVFFPSNYLSNLLSIRNVNDGEHEIRKATFQDEVFCTDNTINEHVINSINRRLSILQNFQIFNALYRILIIISSEIQFQLHLLQ